MARNKYQKAQRKAGRTTMTFYLDRELRERIRKRASLRKVSPSEWANKAFATLLDSVEENDR